MSEQDTTTITESKKRSVGFPMLPLRESVEAIVTLGQHGPDQSHDAASAYLGHSTSNSGAYRTKLAALRDWGLLNRGNRNRVMLSELAQRLVLEAPDHHSATELLLAAFESCRAFGMVYNDSAKDTPLDLQRLRNTVVMRHGVSSEQADRFVDSFIESILYAGLGKFDGTKLMLYQRDAVFGPDGRMPDHAEETPANLIDTPEVADGSASMGVMPVVTRPATPDALRQAWPIDGGEIEFVIRTSKPLPPSIYSLMAKMAQVAEEMRDQLTEPTAEIATPTSCATYPSPTPRR